MQLFYKLCDAIPWILVALQDGLEAKRGMSDESQSAQPGDSCNLGSGADHQRSGNGGHISGIKVTITDRDFVNYDVDVDVTLVVTFTNVSSYTYIGNYARSAIDWGDGDALSTSILYGVSGESFPGAPSTGIYRGSFSRTYDDSGSYTITVPQCCDPPAIGYLTGNLQTDTYTSYYSYTYPYTTTFLTNTAQAIFPPPSVIAAFLQQDDCGMGAELVVILPPLIMWRERRRKRSARSAGHSVER